MRIATWNVNSIRARWERLAAWLGRTQPDLVCLQETKVIDEAFPFEDLRTLGYQAATFGQRTYNGVALLARGPIDEVTRGFGDATDELGSRFIVGRVATPAGGTLRVASAYVPNGQTVGSDKFAGKLAWLAALRAWLERSARRDELLLVGGDFNVAPEERDVHDPEAWAGEVLFHPQARAALANVVSWGLVDALRARHEEAGLYSWWDYRQLGFPKNRGLRIDHLLCTPSLVERCEDVRIDRDERKGKLPSDHAPVIGTFDV